MICGKISPIRRRLYMKREEAFEILKKYNKDEFHIRHALTVEGVMRYFAKELNEDVEYWGNVGLLHDVDFELYPEEHCKKCIELLRENNVDESIIHSICSHGYGLCTDVKPEHIMEKVLFATDELTGLIWAAAKMRPSKSIMDMELSSLKKKFKDKKFAAGCSRDVIIKGAEQLGWDLDTLLEKTILAMREDEAKINEYMEKEYNR
jgi:putative nucleotidyltransferase with HDIG domain